MSPSTVTPRSPSYPAFQAIERQPQVFVDRFRQEGDSLVGPPVERQVLLDGARRREGSPGGGEGESRPRQVERARDEDGGPPAVPPEELGRVARVLGRVPPEGRLAVPPEE